MEGLEYKLSLNNTIVTAQIFSKIIQNIKEKHKSETKDCPELTFLKDKCMVPDPAISEVAGTGLISLVKDGVLDIENTLTDVITSIPLTRCYSSLASIVGNLLYLDMKNKLHLNKEFKHTYNLWLPQHPYITILIENPNTWSCILNEISYLYSKENGECITELFKPLYLYTLCDPDQSTKQLLFRHKIWNIVLSSSGTDILYILCWLQVETRNNLEANSQLLDEAANYIISSNKPTFNLEIFILWQSSLLYNLTLNKMDIRPCICSLKNMLENMDNLVTINCLLLLLTKTTAICSSVYLLDVLNIYQLLLFHQGKEMYLLNAMKAPLLQWLASPSILTAEANQVANSIFQYIENCENSPVKYETLKYFSEQYKTIITSNSDAFMSMEISLLLQHFKEEKEVLKWLEKIENAPNCLMRSIYNFLCGLFLTRNFSSEVTTKVFKIILKYAEHDKSLLSQMFTLILYKLSNTKESNIHHVLLRALPRMVAVSENLSKVMTTIQALSTGSVDLYNFSLSLMIDAWKINHKCYPYLENMLVQHRITKKKWESYVTKAYILKELCRKQPELYGKDMVPHLSNILNECNDADGSLPCSFAIEGIIILCKAEIIDVVTTWATLAPKFKTDTRIPVIKSLCSLINEIPHLPYTAAYLELNDEVVRTLWDYVNIGDPQITKAALDALTSFSLEQICSQLPEKYFDENVILERQKSVVGTPLTVPGKTWLKFLKEHGASKEAEEFLIKMISAEVSSYLKHVYQVKGTREPINYDYLPTHSIVRGIGHYIKTSISKPKDDFLYIACLKIFSKEYSKPLPPLDWCFLQELLHEPKTKDYCVDIACHQVILSGTARRLVENYILAITKNPQENDIENVMRNLKHLANSIQPIILKPFFEGALKLAINKYNKNCEDKLLENILQFLKEVLENGDIQETNKLTIAQVLSDTIFSMDIQSKLFGILLQCIIALPKKFIDEMTILKSDTDVEWLQKLTKIRCTIAVHTKLTPLIWLNEIIQLCSTMTRDDFIFNEFTRVFRSHINNAGECALWLLDLIGQIQAKVAERCTEKEILYFLDVFILAVAEFSGYSIFIRDDGTDTNVQIKELFPQAFNILMKDNDWSVCTVQALEWLYHMKTEEIIPSVYRNIFRLTLQSLRHDDSFIKNSKWMKYLSCDFSNK